MAQAFERMASHNQGQRYIKRKGSTLARENFKRNCATYKAGVVYYRHIKYRDMHGHHEVHRCATAWGGGVAYGYGPDCATAYAQLQHTIKFLDEFVKSFDSSCLVYEFDMHMEPWWTRLLKWLWSRG